MNKEPDRSQRKALGKGLSALLPSRGSAPQLQPESAPVPSFPVAAAQPVSARPQIPEQFEDFQNIPILKIKPNEQQPRDMFDGDKLQELSQSIRANGLIQPITVYRSGPDEYRIIAGERRWRAAQIAGLTEIPALVRTVEEEKLLELALIENIQREDLNPIEIATAFQRLSSQHGLSHEEIAERTGKDRSTITNFLRLLRLSSFVRNELARGTVSVGHARALLNLQEDYLQQEICRRIIDNQLSVRETERLVKDLTKRAPPTERLVEVPNEADKVDPNVRAAIDEMAAALGTRVRLIAKSDKAGKLEIEYYSQDDLDRIYSVIVKS